MKEDYTRRISLGEDFMNHNTNDLLYTYMMCSATYHPIEKKIYLKKQIYLLENMAKIVAMLCGKSKKTIDRHL